MSITFIDNQCFAGGLTLGVSQAGWQLRHKAEDPGGFGISMCEANRHLLGDNWESQAAAPADWDVPSCDIDLVAGNPPCSGFSVMSPKSFRGADSPINQCMRDLFAYASRVRPHAVLMESVPSAFKLGLDLMRELADTLINAMGKPYYVTHVLQNNLSLGGCSRRKRYFLVVTDFPFGVEPAPLAWLPTLGDAVRDLRNLELNWEMQPYEDPPTWWSLAKRSKSGMVDGHQVPMLPPRNHERFWDIAGADGIDWPPGMTFDLVMKSYYEKYGELPESWRYQSSSKEWGHLTRDKVLIMKDFNVGGYAQTRYWPWDEPAYVMTGHGPSQVWHPDGRFFTHREAARVMGFPDDWRIAPLSDDRTLPSLWGKGVSVDCGRWVGTWLRESMLGRPGSIMGQPFDDGGDTLLDVSGWWKNVPGPGIPATPVTQDVTPAL